MICKDITIKIGRYKTIIHRNTFISTFLLPLLIVFRFLFQDGNLNLLYFFGIVCLMVYISKEKYFRRNITILIASMVILTVIQKIYSPLYSSINKTLISGLKIVLCYSIYIYAKNNLSFEIWMRICKNILRILCSLFIFALIFRNSKYLWITDYVNRYIGQRLKLFAIEPGQLGFIISFCLLYLLIAVIEKGAKKGDIIEILGGFAIFLFSFPMNAILSMIGGILTYFVIRVVRSVKRRSISKRAFALVALLIAITIIVLTTQNSISQRLNDILFMRDSSFQSRFIIPIQYFPELLRKSHYIGIGLGNMNTDAILAIIPFIYSNSFLYFIVETGIAGIIFIICWLRRLCFACNNSSEEMRLYLYPLFIFIIIIQISGGYFTDPVIWIIYGVIMNKNKES